MRSCSPAHLLPGTSRHGFECVSKNSSSSLLIRSPQVIGSSRRRAHASHAIRAYERPAGLFVVKLGGKKRLVGELPADQRDRAGVNRGVVDSVTQAAPEQREQVFGAEKRRHAPLLIAHLAAAVADPAAQQEFVPALAHIGVAPYLGGNRLGTDLLRCGNIDGRELTVGVIAADRDPEIAAVDEEHGLRLAGGMVTDDFDLAVGREPIERRTEDRRDLGRRRNALPLKLAYMGARLFLVAAGVARDDDARGPEIERAASL